MAGFVDPVDSPRHAAMLGSMTGIVTAQSDASTRYTRPLAGGY